MKRASVEPILNAISVEYKSGISRIKNLRKEARVIKAGPGEDLSTLLKIDEEARQKRIDEIVRETEIAVQRICEDFAQKEKDFFTLRGEDITDDVKLLQLSLTAEQVRELQIRYIGSPTMLSALNEYAKSRNFPPLNLQSAQEREGIVNFFVKMARPRFIENTQANPRWSFEQAIESEGGYKDKALAKVYEGAAE